MAFRITHKSSRSGSSIPAYQRIEEDIRAKVRDGRLPAGTMLAGRHSLAKEYGVSLSTLQQSIAKLTADGILEIYDRRGTFIAPTQISQGREVEAQGGTLLDGTDGRSDVAPALPASAQLVARPVNATLGILSTGWINGKSLDVGSFWARLAIRSMEQVFSAANGPTHYYDRFPPHLGPYECGSDDARGIPICKAIGSLQAAGANALAIIGLNESQDMSDEILAAVDIERVPIVYISWHEIRSPLAQVFYDNRFAGYQAAKHLLRKGYRRLLFLAPFAETWLFERIEGAREAIRHSGSPLETLEVHPAEPVHKAYDRLHADETMYTVAQQAFTESGIFSGAGSDELRGVIAPNDNTAYAVIKAATERGKTAGIDYGLIGFDDDPRSCVAGLTTVRPPVEAMGKEAGRLLIRAMQGDDIELRVCLRSHVIPRASTSKRSGTAPKHGG